MTNTGIRAMASRVPGAKFLYYSFVATPGSWIFHVSNTEWMRNRDNHQQLPFLYRLFSIYFRHAPKRGNNHVFGAETIFHAVASLTRWFGLRSTTAAHTGEYTVYLNLLDPRSLLVPREIISDKSIAALPGFLRPGDTFVDVGANHGSFSIVASRLVGDEGLTVAVEPQQVLADLVDTSLSANHAAHFQVHRFGCSDETGTTTFYVPRASSGSAGLFREHSAFSAHLKIDVELRRFDDAVDWQRFPGSVFVKLDVEGAEMKFISGAREFLSVKRPPVMLEVNPSSIAASGSTATTLVGALAELGYDSFYEIGDRTPHPLDGLHVGKNRNVVVFCNTQG